MLKYFTFVIFLFAIECSFAQDLSATLKMPELVAPGDDYVVEITITKGEINSYIKFSQKLPPHFKATEIDSKGGDFTFEDSIIRIVWFFPPANNELIFSYKVSVPKDASGLKKIGGKIYYFFNTNREVFNFEKKYITIGTAKDLIVSTPPKKVLDSISSNSPPLKNVESTLTNTLVITTTDTTVLHITSASSATNILTKAVQPKDTIAVSDTNSITKAEPVKNNLIAPIIKAAPIKDTVALTILNNITKEIAIKDTLPISTAATLSKAIPGKAALTDTTTEKLPNTTKIKEEPATGELSYCVQLGTFKEDVPLELANKFLKISARGIKNFKDNNGFTTFTVGNFKTHDEAINLKKEMLEKGFQGAFIVAFPTNKISNSSMKNKIAETTGQINNSDPTSQTIIITKAIPSNNTGAEPVTIKDKEPIVNNPPVAALPVKIETKAISKEVIANSKVPVNTISSSLNKSYRVQLGAFKEEVPLETANKFLKIAAKGVKNMKDNRGFTIYTVGNFSIRDEAVNLKNEMIEKGFKDAFIVTFENGEPVK